MQKKKIEYTITLGIMVQRVPCTYHHDMPFKRIIILFGHSKDKPRVIHFQNLYKNKITEDNMFCII